MLTSKSLTELRTLCLSLGIKFSFGDDALSLIQKLETKAKPSPEVPPLTRPQYDARLMTKPPGKSCNQDLVLYYLKPYVEYRGLHVTFPDEETWEMRCGKKVDTGPLRMPPRVLIRKAEDVCQ